MFPDSFWHQRYERSDLLPQPNGLSHCGNVNHPKSREPREEPGLVLWTRGAKLQWFTGATEITRISSAPSRNWKLHTPNAVLAAVFVLHFFGVKLGHFLCFPTWAVPFCGPSHYLFMRLPCLLLLHLFSIRRHLVSTQLSGRGGKA